MFGRSSFVRGLELFSILALTVDATESPSITQVGNITDLGSGLVSHAGTQPGGAQLIPLDTSINSSAIPALAPTNTSTFALSADNDTTTDSTSNGNETSSGGGGGRQLGQVSGSPAAGMNISQSSITLADDRMIWGLPAGRDAVDAALQYCYDHADGQGHGTSFFRIDNGDYSVILKPEPGVSSINYRTLKQACSIGLKFVENQGDANYTVVATVNDATHKSVAAFAVIPNIAFYTYDPSKPRVSLAANNTVAVPDPNFGKRSVSKHVRSNRLVKRVNGIPVPGVPNLFMSLRVTTATMFSYFSEDILRMAVEQVRMETNYVYNAVNFQSQTFQNIRFALQSAQGQGIYRFEMEAVLDALQNFVKTVIQRYPDVQVIPELIQADVFYSYINNGQTILNHVAELSLGRLDTSLCQYYNAAISRSGSSQTGYDGCIVTS